MAHLFQHYTAVSSRLGLAFEDGRIHGSVDGIAVQMWFGTHSVHTVALLPRPAAFEVSIATRGLVARLGALFGSHAGEIGDAAFDKVFAVRSANVAQVAAHLDPAARSALLEVATEDLHPVVDATSVHLRRFSASAISDSEEVIERDLREAARLARLIGASFAAP